MRFLTKNIWWKLLSLLIACGVWINIASEPELSTIFSAPVEFKNYPPDLEISSDNIVESIDVEARGASGQLRDISMTSLAAIIDFSTVKAPGERTFTLSSREIALPRGLSLIRTIPAQLRFNFEHRARRGVKVLVKFSGSLPAGLAISDYTVTPSQLQIAGPESRVAAARDAVSDPFDLNRFRQNPSQSLAVYMPDPQVRFVDRPRVTVNIHVKKVQ